MINKHKLGIVLAGFFGLWHIVWSILVALGMAKSLMDMSLRLHFMTLSHEVLPFDLGTAIGLVVIALVVGYIFGWILGTLWNWIRR